MVGSRRFLTLETSTPVSQLDAYRKLIALDQPFVPLPPPRPEDRADQLDELVRSLRVEAQAGTGGVLHQKRPVVREIRELLTVRPPLPLSDAFQAVLDSLLQDDLVRRGRLETSSLRRMSDCITTAAYAKADKCALWEGDITMLRADAIVNAANAELLGCFRPFHACIDNAIHWAAGPRLRADCSRIMRLQGRPEPTGHAKATRGYNLPSRYVLHTVGPIVEGGLNAKHEAALAACYRACLDLAAQLNGVRTIAFCAISTGVFGFPKVPAARVALRTVAQWLDQHPAALDLVVFNVFTDPDRAAYENALDKKRGMA